MDYIELERIEPAEGPRLVTPKPKPVPNQLTAVTGIKYPRASTDLSSQFNKLRTRTFAPLPIPPQVIPTMAFTDEVDEYERLFLQRSERVDNLCIKELLSPFSNIEPPITKTAHLGKILFLTKLLVKINKAEMNYDPAIICSDKKSEASIRDHFYLARFNVRRLSELFPRSGVFGVMIKIRKRIKDPAEFRPITRGEVDAMFVYDSACKADFDKESSLLKGVSKKSTPILFYIACMDTVEMRIHTFNRCSPVPLNWNTKVGSLSHDLQQSLLLQPNRRPNHIAANAWNDYLSQTIFNWIIGKDASIYVFKFPTRGALLLELDSFLLHHPHPIIENLVSKPAPTPSPNAIAWVEQAAADKTPVAAATSKPTEVPSAIKTTARASASGDQPTACRPDVIPAGIHPDRAMMLQKNSASDEAMNTSKKRERDPDVEKENHKSKKTSKLPDNLPTVDEDHTIEIDHDVSMEERAETPSSSNVEIEKEKDSTEVKSLATDFTARFNDFFANAFQKFENDIRNIKL